MSLYESLQNRKMNGEKLILEDLSPSELKKLFIDEAISDRLIAELYDVKPSKITYRRRKHGISISHSGLDDYLNGTSKESRALNEASKTEILKKENLDIIVRAITHFAFRNGPVEDMHASPHSQLSDDDMMTLNKFMVDRLAYIFKLIIEERWIEFNYMVKFNGIYGPNWDKAKPDDGSTRKLIEIMLEDKK